MILMVSIDVTLVEEKISKAMRNPKEVNEYLGPQTEEERKQAEEADKLQFEKDRKRIEEQTQRENTE